LGKDGYKLGVLKNTHSITIDEAIIAYYFDHYFTEAFEIEKWKITQAPDPYQPESFGFTGHDLLYYEDSYREAFIFDNRIVTLTYLGLDFKNNRVNLCIDLDGNCFDLPKNLNKFFVDKENQSILNILPQRVTLKVKIDTNGEIKDILAGGIHDYDNDDYGITWPIAKNNLGAGSMPFIL